MGKFRETLKTLLFSVAIAAAVYFAADVLLERTVSDPQAERGAAEETIPERAAAQTEPEANRTEPEADGTQPEVSLPETEPASGSGTEPEWEKAPFSETGYAYSVLGEEEQKLYEEIYMAVMDFSPAAALSVRDTDRIERVFACVMADHPEIFYVDGYTLTVRALGEDVQDVSFQAEYTLTGQQIQERLLSVKKEADAVLSALTEETDDYETLKTLYESVVLGTEYDLQAPENQTICSVFLYGKSVCQGYAKAFQYLCQRAGIPAVLVTGTVEDGSPHAWTAVCCNGEWYYADPAWGDAGYQLEDAAGGSGGNGTDGGPKETVDYDFFLVTTEQISRTHTADDIFPLPYCGSLTDNYYVREDLYFTRADMEQAAEAFEAAAQEGRGSVTLKCADETVYGELYERLLTRQEIFRYLPGDSVSYAASREQLTLTFFL